MKLTITNKALHRLGELRAASEEKTLRVMVQGGGCSGLKYSLAFITPAYEVLDLSKVQLRSYEIANRPEPLEVFVDYQSALFLDGVTIDFDDSLNGKGFEFNNPKAKTTCGCGESFGV